MSGSRPVRVEFGEMVKSNAPMHLCLSLDSTGELGFPMFDHLVARQLGTLLMPLVEFATFHEEV